MALDRRFSQFVEVATREVSELADDLVYVCVDKTLDVEISRCIYTLYTRASDGD